MTLTAYRSVHPDFTSSHGFRWPFPGGAVKLPTPKDGFSRGDPCPRFVGDGVCLAKTPRGAASGSIPMHTVLICEYTKASVLGEDDDKIRVKACKVREVLDFPALLRNGQVAKEVLANLRYADLRYADLSYANLRYADLSYADLRYANLSLADLSYANLSLADLSYADLSYANLRYAVDADTAGAFNVPKVSA